MRRALILMTLLAASTAWGYTITVDGDGSDWNGIPSFTSHSAGWDEATWIYPGRAVDQRDAPAYADQDLTEVRVTADGTDLYLMIKVQDITDESLHVMMAIDTDQDPSDTGLHWIGDDSIVWGGSMVLGAGPEQYSERNVEIHYVSTDSVWVCEFFADDGSVWYDLTPPGDNWDVAVDATHNVMEVRLSFGILGGINQADTIGLSLATAVNGGTWCNDDDTTTDQVQPDAIDVMGGAVGSTDDAWVRDLGNEQPTPEYDLDWYYLIDLGNTIQGTVTPTVPPTMSPTPDPASPTATPTPEEMINAWHIPDSPEPASVTMRNPLVVDTGTLNVYIYLGAYPQGVLWDEGTDLFYRLQGEVDWQTADFNFDVNEGPNEYWLASFSNDFAEGETVEYYLRADGNPAVTKTTFIHDAGGGVSTATLDEPTAQAAPFTFTVQAGTGGCTAINAWHIPSNNEPAAVTMRNPLTVEEDHLFVYVYVGVYPQFTLWDEGTDLYYRLQGAMDWQLSDFNFDVNEGSNEYWMASFENVFAQGETVEYYIRTVGNPAQYDTTYVYDDGTKFTATTCDEMVAQAAPFTFTVQTAQPTCDLINSWHIPSSSEPSTVTMRNPVDVDTNTLFVFFYLGAFPQSTLVDEGTDLFYRLQGAPSWDRAAFNFDVDESSNEYWMASIPAEFPTGQTVEYYLRAAGNPSTYDTTFVFDDGTKASGTTCDESVAQAYPYSFTVAAAPTPEPTPSPCAEINCWHIPVNNEPPVPDITMRNPVVVDEDALYVYFYLGAYPQATLWDEGTDLFYRLQGEVDWLTADFNHDSDHGMNEYWLAAVENTWSEGQVVEYYIRAFGNGLTYDLTFLFGDDDSSSGTCDEAIAQAAPYTFTIGGVPTVVPTMGGFGLILTLLGIGGLLIRRRR